MGFTQPNFPRVEPETFLQQPFLERVKTLAAELGRQRLRRAAR